MKLKVVRFPSSKLSTIGKLYIDNVYQCFTLEDPVREEEKIYGKTAIPAGTYRVTLRTEGTIHEDYKKRFGVWHRGTLWIRDIPGYEYVLIHIGNYPEDTLGCILVGLEHNDGEDKIGSSTLAYQLIYPVISHALFNGEEVQIEII